MQNKSFVVGSIWNKVTADIKDLSRKELHMERVLATLKEFGEYLDRFEVRFEARLEALEIRLDERGKRFEARFDDIERRFDAQEKRLADMQDSFKQRITAVEKTRRPFFPFARYYSATALHSAPRPFRTKRGYIG